MNAQEPDSLINEARLLMPWYLTNKLSAEEQDVVNKALEQSDELRKEFLNEEKMMRLVKENRSLLELSAVDTTEQRLTNTLARIDQEEMRRTADNPDPVKKSHQTGKKSATGWLDRLFSKPLLDFNWLSPANAVFAALLVLQVGVLGYYMQTSGSESNNYETASSSKATADNATEQQKIKLLMEFEEDARYGAVCDFLNHWNARIVDGPNDTNMFSVEMNNTNQTDAETLVGILKHEAAQANVPVSFIGQKSQ